MKKNSFSAFLKWLIRLELPTEEILSFLAQEWLTGQQKPIDKTDFSFFFSSEKLSSNEKKMISEKLSLLKISSDGEKEAFTPEILSLFFEKRKKKSHEQGAFYTPFPTAKQLCNETLKAWLGTALNTNHCVSYTLPEQIERLSSTQKSRLKKLLNELSVCDPAAGTGGLLIPCWLELAHFRSKLFPQKPLLKHLEWVAQHNLYAGDIDTQAIKILRLRMLLTLRAEGSRLPFQKILPFIYEGNALNSVKGESVWKERFPALFEKKGGFDLVLSNPPYIGQKNHASLFEPLRKDPRWEPLLAPKSDLLYLFFYLALEILHEKGFAGFLTTAYFTTAAGATRLRKYLQQKSAFLRIIDFEEQRLFVRALGQHSLMTVLQKTLPSTVPCKRGRTEQDIVPQTALYKGKDAFLQTRPNSRNPLLQSALEKMAAAEYTLQEMAHISNGLMTGCDKISAAHLSRFPLRGVKKGEGVFVLSETEKQSLRLSEQEAKKLKPFFKNSDIHPYVANETPKRFLIDFFYPNDRETDFSAYPRLMSHLARFKPVLSARKQNNNGIDKQIRQGKYWFGSVRRKMNFETPKLVAPHRSFINAFACVQGPWYASSDVYFISPFKEEEKALWSLLALLNSAPYYLWLFSRGKRKGPLLELYAAPLKEIPIPAIPPKEELKLAELAKRLSRKPPIHIQKRAEAAINARVGRLFQFTNEEIHAVKEFRNSAFAKNSRNPCV